MPNVQELEKLKDIHLPPPISWWPLAPGWYGLIGLFTLLLLTLVFWARRRARFARPKKQALNLLATYKQDYEKNNNAPLTSAHVSELLKRVAIAYYPREQVASLQGKDWIEFLNNTSRGICFNDLAHSLLETPFKAQSRESLQPLFAAAELWIKQRRKPC